MPESFVIKSIIESLCSLPRTSQMFLFHFRILHPVLRRYKRQSLLRHVGGWPTLFLVCTTRTEAGWLAHPFFACTTQGEAAPPFALFKGWVPRPLAPRSFVAPASS